jgi:hypothetical protein
VHFSSSNCGQWRWKKQSCFSNGNLVDGRLAMCWPVQKDTETGVQGGNGGVLDPGVSGGSKDGTMLPSPFGSSKGDTLSP